MLYNRLHMKLILAQGNPGPEYALSRHNIGFMALDYLREKQKLVDFQPKSKFQARNNFQIPNAEECVRARRLEFEIWILFGIWILEFGTSFVFILFVTACSGCMSTRQRPFSGPARIVAVESDGRYKRNTHQRLCCRKLTNHDQTGSAATGT